MGTKADRFSGRQTSIEAGRRTKCPENRKTDIGIDCQAGRKAGREIYS
jgi:hypothetical protein